VGCKASARRRIAPCSPFIDRPTRGLATQGGGFAGAKRAEVELPALMVAVQSTQLDERSSAVEAAVQAGATAVLLLDSAGEFQLPPFGWWGQRSMRDEVMGPHRHTGLQFDAFWGDGPFPARGWRVGPQRLHSR